jgi:tetratricopeptide (TPR) repeat protein
VRRIGRRAGEPKVKTPLPRSWLEWLDGLRYDKPEKALGLIEDTLDFVQDEDLPLALGVWASACRHVSRYEEGFLACREGLRLARRGGDRLAEVDLLQRLSFLVTSLTADYSAALGLSERAAVLCARLGDLNRLGQIMVDQGVLLLYLECYDESESSFSAGLVYLQEKEYRHRVSALHGIGLVHQQQHEPEKAIDYARKASELASSRFEQGKIQWLIGCASADLEAWEEAFLALERAFDGLLEVSVVDAGLVVCDHVKALLQAGKLEEARARSQAARTLMEPLARYPVASAAIRDLIRCEQEGHRLTVAFVIAVRERIEKGRQAVAPRP